jgi:uncharacterized Zn-finger protein
MISTSSHSTNEAMIHPQRENMLWISKIFHACDRQYNRSDKTIVDVVKVGPTIPFPYLYLCADETSRKELLVAEDDVWIRD